jgi:hypothetical protein
MDLAFPVAATQREDKRLIIEPALTREHNLRLREELKTEGEQNQKPYPSIPSHLPYFLMLKITPKATPSKAANST